MDESKASARLPEPRANPALFGHATAEATLEAAFRSGRLAHAWLLVGPHGIGKATLGFRFARFVLADGKRDNSRPGLALADDHPIFRRVAAGGHTDFLTIAREIDPKSGRRRAEIVIDDIRRVHDFLSLTPGEGGWRVALIDGAEDMNANCANALLKVLEEPPSRALLLLISHAPAGLLPTIRSRCRRLDLRPLQEADLRAALAPVLATESDQAAIGALLRLAEGSPGRAAGLIEEGGVALYRELIVLLTDLPKLDVVRCHALAERTTGREGVATFRLLSDLLLWWLAGLVRTGAARARPETVPGESALYTALVTGRRRGGLERWGELWENLRRQFALTEALNLDFRQALIDAFGALQDTARTGG
jgi:DNA polymerase-3 subunit delta'